MEAYGFDVDCDCRFIILARKLPEGWKAKYMEAIYAKTRWCQRTECIARLFQK